MATFYRTVDVDVDIDLDDFDDEEIIDYMECRGYTVTKDAAADASFVDVVWNIERGNLKEALIQLEREVPELKGIAALN
jgi:ectoine hydroxylase-related dioxygenase (phytanoyl-CoA dioxygenase family)